MISKKNIRYEGILYSINETNSTLALQNVRSFGTEGREKTDPSTSFVAPQEGVHAYLLFRGCDIKDLHVHEQEQEAAAPAEPESQPSAAPTPKPTEETGKAEEEKKKDLPPPPTAPATATAKKGTEKKTPAPSNSNSQRRSNTRRNNAAVGTGASLLNRKARGAVQGGTYRYREST